MGDDNNFLQRATIRSDGRVGRELPDVFEVFVVETGEDSFWFEASADYAENGNDFQMTIRNFGLHHKTAAGSHTPIVRKCFSPSEAKSAEARVKLFFRGSECDGIQPYSPFPGAKGRCIGVAFSKGWITLKCDGSALKVDNLYHTLFIETAEGSFWLDVDYEFTEDDIEFRVIARKFILWGRMIPLFPRYTTSEALKARALVKATFLGSANNTPADYSPFRIEKARCLGVVFADGWITVT
jgi:hypothetical protein